MFLLGRGTIAQDLHRNFTLQLTIGQNHHRSHAATTNFIYRDVARTMRRNPFGRLRALRLHAASSIISAKRSSSDAAG